MRKRDERSKKSLKKAEANTNTKKNIEKHMTCIHQFTQIKDI
jgi:hypothetical protein